ncbi:hypothetical protein Hanom_Chr16g01471921 [Helianthus anomalus]
MQATNFVLNFLVFYNTILGETTQDSSIDMRFLPAVHRALDITSFNWCEYMIRCLDRNVDGWSPKDNFFGPMPWLVAALVNGQNKFKPNEWRSMHLIEDIMQDDIDSLSMKLDTITPVNFRPTMRQHVS